MGENFEGRCKMKAFDIFVQLRATTGNTSVKHSSPRSDCIIILFSYLQCSLSFSNLPRGGPGAKTELETARMKPVMTASEVVPTHVDRMSGIIFLSATSVSHSCTPAAVDWSFKRHRRLGNLEEPAGSWKLGRRERPHVCRVWQIGTTVGHGRVS